MILINRLKIFEMGPEEVQKYCEQNKTVSSIPKVIKTGYQTLDLIHFFTCGADEVRAWTIRVRDCLS
jgi:obg-like ATPase 1